MDTSNQQPKTPLPQNPLPSAANLGGSVKRGFRKFIPSFVYPKLLMIVLLVIIGTEVVYALFVLLSPSPGTNVVNVTSNLENSPDSSVGKIALSTDGENFQVGDDIPVLINISTGDYASDGTDVVLDYEPEFLEVSESSIIEGDLYSDYLGKRVDARRKTITVSGIVTQWGEGFSGEGELARVNFKALKNGETKVKVKFEKGSTTESNIIQSKSGTDVLSEVEDISIVISK